MIPRVAAIADLDDDDGRLVEKGMNTDYVMVSKEASLGIAELSCTVSEMDSCVHQCVLPEVRSFTANAGTKVVVLLKDHVFHCKLRNQGCSFIRDK